MSRNTLMLTITLFVLSFPSSSETLDKLVKRHEIYYKKSSDLPFTGKITGLSEGWIKDGKPEGPWLEFHRKRKLYVKGTYKDGKREGSWSAYWSNGQLLHQAMFRNGKLDGSWNDYNHHGNVGKMFATTAKRR